MCLRFQSQTQLQKPHGSAIWEATISTMPVTNRAVLRIQNRFIVRRRRMMNQPNQRNNDESENHAHHQAVEHGEVGIIGAALRPCAETETNVKATLYV